MVKQITTEQYLEILSGKKNVLVSILHKEEYSAGFKRHTTAHCRKYIMFADKYFRCDGDFGTQIFVHFHNESVGKILIGI